MSLSLHYHPLASFCHKVLIAFYENDTPFESVIIDFGNPESVAAFKAIWPIAKMPVLVDAARGATVAESTIVIEYLDTFYAGNQRLIPEPPDAAWRVRFWDRFFDNYVHEPMQKIVADFFRPKGGADPTGVEQARGQIAQSYVYLEATLGGTWVAGDRFTLGDCAASPALFYANTILPIPATQPKLRRYLRRLMERPSFARVLKEAEPSFLHFPLDPKPTLTPPEV